MSDTRLSDTRPLPRRVATGRVDATRGVSRTPRGAPVRSTRVRPWTGRAAMSRATDSGVPRVVTSGTHRTRVSEMRDAAPTASPATRAAAARLAEQYGLSGLVTVR